MYRDFNAAGIDVVSDDRRREARRSKFADSEILEF